jgi:hypothetical protein
MRGIFELLVAATAVTAGQPSNEVVLRGRLTPTDLAETMSGTCGRHRYSIELQHHGNRTTLSLKVDDRFVASVERDKVVEALMQGYFMYEPKIAECFWDRPNARFRLLTGARKDGGKPIWLSFEVSPDGKVSALHQD